MTSSRFRSNSGGYRHLAALLSLALGGAAIVASHPAAGQERWLAKEEQAVAILPAPQGETAIISASMMCAEQRWSFRLDLAMEAKAPDGEVVLNVDGSKFATAAERAEAGRLGIPVPFETLEPLKRGLRLDFSFGEEDAARLGTPIFSLIGSRAAITAMEEICSRPDMSAYRSLTFTPYSSYMGLARKLRSDDIQAFRLATASEPELSVAMAEFGDGRRVLFTKLCGSSWYFGRSGCNITGFAPDRGGEEWRVVYDTEGVLLHIDDSVDDYGWPNLVTLPSRPPGNVSSWRWEGSRYRLLAH